MTERSASPEQIEQEISATRAEIDETLVALQNKLSPGQLLDQVLGYAKDGGGEFAANFGRTVRDNPVPVALLGLGVGWLMMSGRGPHGADRYEEDGRGRRRSPADAGSVGGSPTDPAASRFSGAGADPRGRATSGAARSASASQADSHGLKDKAAEAGSKVKEGAGAATSRAGEKVSQMAEGAREQFGAARERVGDLRDELDHRAAAVRATTSDYAGRAREGLSHARESVGRYYNDNPLVVGAAVFAAGAALAAMLPATRRERELVGERSEDAKAAAREKVAEGAEKAKAVAAAAVRAAKDRAKREGLDPEKPEQPEMRRSAAGAQAPSGSGDRRVAPEEAGKTGSMGAAKPGAR